MNDCKNKAGNVQTFQKGSQTISSYTISLDCHESSFVAVILDYGATLTHFKINGKDVLLGFDDPFDYMSDENPYFGAIVGRSCNRTKEGKFTLDGIDYTLPINNGPNSLHGGTKGVSMKMWSVTHISSDKVELCCKSEHMDQGYPGTVVFKVSYRLLPPGDLSIDLMATLESDAKSTYVIQ